MLLLKQRATPAQRPTVFLKVIGTHFSTGLISEAQGRVSSMLTPLHQALHQHVKQAAIIHIDETTHQRNGEFRTRWIWLLSGANVVYQTIGYFRNQESAKAMLGTDSGAVVVTDQCASYHWLDPSRHLFCLAHVLRNLQQMADYAGGGLTAHIGARLVLLCQSLFRTQHRFEQHELTETQWRRRMLRLRGSVILRKICFGTSSHRGEQFRSRVLSVVETCKKRGLSALDVISEIVEAVTAKRPYPDVFGLTRA
jgi:transposase